MPTNHWNRTVSLGSLIRDYRAGAYDVPELADRVAEQIEKSGWLEDSPYPDTLRDHLGALKQSTTEREYSLAFDRIYDAADEDRVWIETF